MRQLSNDEKDELVCFFISRYSHELAEKLNDLLKTHPFGHCFQITGAFYAAKEQEQVFLSIDGIRIDYTHYAPTVERDESRRVIYLNGGSVNPTVAGKNGEIKPGNVFRIHTDGTIETVFLHVQ